MMNWTEAIWISIQSEFPGLSIYKYKNYDKILLIKSSKIKPSTRYLTTRKLFYRMLVIMVTKNKPQNEWTFTVINVSTG